jgi:hypothetical protein
LFAKKAPSQSATAKYPQRKRQRGQDPSIALKRPGPFVAARLRRLRLVVSTALGA